MMCSTKFLDKRNPHLSIGFKLFDLRWIDYITQKASDHSIELQDFRAESGRGLVFQLWGNNSDALC